MTKVKVKKAVEVPASIQAVISKVINTPFDRIGESLKDFVWQYDKGDFHHWIALFNYFDTFFEEQVSKRADLTLKFNPNQADAPFPHENILAVLKTTTLILENCSNKHLYGSTEHLTTLLAAPHAETVAATLDTLVAFLRKTHHNTVRWQVNQQLNARLLSLCRGWGGKEEGLDLIACASADETAVKTVLPQCTTLHFEFFADPAATAADGAQHSGVQKLHLPALAQYQESEHDILKELVTRYNVPENHRFELLCRIRIAKNFASLQGRRHLVHVRLLAFYVVFQSHPSAEEVLSLFTSEPEFVTELVALVQQEDLVPENLRTLALKSLAVQLLDRSRHTSVINAITAGGQSGLLAMLLHKSVASIVAQGHSSLDRDAGKQGAAAGVNGAATSAPPTATAAAAAAVPGGSSSATSSSAAGGTTSSSAAGGVVSVPSQQFSVQFVDALLSLVNALVATTQGCSALADAGIISALLPLLKDTHPEHVTLVYNTVKILEAYMDFSQPAATMFRDLGGLTDMIDRLCIEVGIDPSTITVSTHIEQVAESTTPITAPSTAPSATTDAGNTAAAADTAAGTADAAKAAGEPVKQLPYTRRLLLKLLLRAMSLASFAPSSGTGTRPSEVDTQKLYKCLEAMFRRPAEFGGSLFSLAANVMTDLIHHDPLCFRSLDEAGLPQAFLDTIKTGALATQETVSCIPNTLAALCLNTGGLRQVQEGKALHVLLPISTSKKFLKALSSDAPNVLGAGLEELFRFVPHLREEGIEVIVTIFRALCILGGDKEELERLEQAQAAAAAAAADKAAAPATEEGPAPMDSDEAAAAAEAGPSVAAAAAPQEAAPAGAGAGAGAAATDGAEPMEMDVEDAAPAAVDSAAATDHDGAAAAGDGAVAAEVAGAVGERVEGAAAEGAAADAAAAAAAGDVEMTAAPADATVEGAQGRASTETSTDVTSPPPRLPLVDELAAAVSAARDGGMESHLSDCINHATRMLEPLLQNSETSKLFVEKGGVDLLLKLHTLPRLHPSMHPSFSFSSASHPLLAAFRIISPNHAEVSVKARDVLVKQIEEVLPRTLALRDVCVPTMPEAERDEYVRQLTATAGLIAVGSAVARNAPGMLMQVSMGSRPVIAKMGEVERAVMQQLWVAEQWKVTQATPTEDKAASPDATATPSMDTAAEVPLDPLAEDSGVDADLPPLVGDLPDAPDGEVDVDGDADAGDNMALDAGLDREVGAVQRNGEVPSKSSKTKKKSGEEIAYDVLDQFYTIFRSFYTAVAKSIHTPARRREETGPQPTNPAKAAALSLALTLKANLAYKWEQPDNLNPAVRAKCHASYLARLGQQLNAVLFDSRRRSCQSLILNYFVALSGLKTATKRFQDAAQLMWDSMQAEAAADEKAAAGAGIPAPDASTTEAGPSTDAAGPSTSAGEADAAMTDAAAPSPATGAVVPDAKEVRVAAEKAVLWFLSVYEHLSNVTMIFTSPQANTMLVAPMPPVPGITTTETSKDTSTFIKDVQSEILAAVVPLWAHPKLADCSAPVLNNIVHILNLCAGTSANAPSIARQGQRPTNQRQPPPLDPLQVQRIVEMGFSQARAEEALRRVGVTGVLRVEAAMEWLFSHPEEPAASAAPAAEPADTLDLSAAIGPSLNAIAQSEDLPTPAAPSEDAEPAEPAKAEVPGASQLVEGAVTLLYKRPASGYSVAELLVTVAQQDEGAERPAIVEHLVKAVAAGFEAKVKEGLGASGDGKAVQVFVPLQLLLMVLSSDAPAKEVAGKLGLAGQVLSMLEAWEADYRARIEGVGESAEMDEAKQREVYQIPVWVEALLLLLELLSNTNNKPAPRNAARPNPAANAGPRANPAAAANVDAPAAGQDPNTTTTAAAGATAATADADTAAAPSATTAAAPDGAAPVAGSGGNGITAAAGTAPAANGAIAAAGGSNGSNAAGGSNGSNAVEAGPSGAVGGGDDDATMATESETPAAPPATEPAPASAAAGAGETQAAAGQEGAAVTVEGAVGKDLQDALKTWRPCGLLTDEEQQRAVTVGLALLRHLHAHAAKWASKDALVADRDPAVPSPASTAQALLHLLARITRKHSIALQVHSQGGVRLMLSLPPAILGCNFTRLEPHITTIIRHILEDHTTLKAWMESEIKNLLTSRGRRDFQNRDILGARNPFRSDSMRNPFRNGAVSVSQLLSVMTRVVSRDPYVFMEALADTCTLEPGGGSDDWLLGLKRAKEEKAAAPGTTAPGGTGAGGTATGGAGAGSTAPGGTGTGGAGAGTTAPGGAGTGGSGAGSAQAGGATKGTGAGAADASVAAPVTPAPPARSSGLEARRSDEGGAARLHPAHSDGVPPDSKMKSSVKTARGTKKVPSTIVEVLDYLLEVLMSFKADTSEPKPASDAPGAMDLDTAPKDTTTTTTSAPAAATTSTPAATPTTTAPAPAPAPSAAPPAVLASSMDATASGLPLARANFARLMNGRDLLMPDMPRAGRLGTGRDVVNNAAAAAASINSMTADVLKQLENIPHNNIIQMLVLKMLTEFCLLFGSTVGFILKRDHESAVRMGKKGSKLEHVAGSVLKQVMHHHLLVLDAALLPSVAEHTSQFLQAICIRSAEGRRRIVHEIVSTLTAGFNLDMDPADRELALAPAPSCKGISLAYNALPGQPSPLKVRAFVTLVSCLVHTPGAHAPPEPRNQNHIGLSHEMIRTMRDAGMVRALTQAIKLINLDNPRAPKALNSILKPLEVLTRVPMGLTTKAGVQPNAAAPAPGGAEPDANAAGATRNAGNEGGNGAPQAEAAGAATGDAGQDVRMEEPSGFDAAAAGPDAMAMLGGGGGLDEMVMYAGSGRATMAEVMEHLMEAMQDAEDGDDMDEDEDGHGDLGSDDEDGEHPDEDDEDEDVDSHGVPIFRIELDRGDMAGDEDEDEDGESEDEHGVESPSDEDEPPGMTDDEEAAVDHVIEGEEEDMDGGHDEDEEEEEEDVDEDEDEILGDEDGQILEDDMGLAGGDSEDSLLLDEYEDDEEEALELMGEPGRRPWRPGMLMDMDMDPFDVLTRMPAGHHSSDFMEVLDDMLSHMPRMQVNPNRLHGRFRIVSSSLDQARERNANPLMQAALLPTQHRLLARPPPTPTMGANPAMYPSMPIGTTTAPDGRLLMQMDTGSWRRVNFPSNLPLQSLLGTQGASLIQAMVDLSASRGTIGFPDLDMDMDPFMLGPAFHRGEPPSPFGGQAGGAGGPGDDSGLDLRALEGPLLGHLRRLNPDVVAARQLPPAAEVRPPVPAPPAPDAQGAAAAAADAAAEVAGAEAAEGAVPQEPAAEGPSEPEAMQAQPEEPAVEEAMTPAPPSATAALSTPAAPGPSLPPPPTEAPISTPAGPNAVALALQAALDAALNAQVVPPIHETPLSIPPTDIADGGGSLHAHPIQPSRAETEDADEVDEASPMDTEDMPRSRTVSMEEAQAGATDADGEATPQTHQPDTTPAEQPTPSGAAEPSADPAEPAGDGSTLSPELRAAAEAAGIDITFLEALPPDLRAEVLAAANPHTAAAPPPPSGEDLQLMEGLDPEVLAALPPDIQQEVLAQQRAEQRRQQAAQQQAAAAQQQQAAGELENDWATLLENSTPDVRDDLLLGANEEFLSRLPSNLVREARELRERHFRQLRDPMPPASLSRAFNMFPHSRRMHIAPSDGRGPARLVPLPLPLEKPKEEVEGPPQMSDEDVLVIIQLLKLHLPILKTQLQKLLGNLCNHSITRSVVLKALLAMLHSNSKTSTQPVPNPDDATSMDTEEPTTAPSSTDADKPGSLLGRPGSASLATALDQLTVDKPESTSILQPASPLPVAAASAATTGQTTAQVVRRVLDALIYLSKHNQKVATLIMSLQLSSADLGTERVGVQDARGKGKAVADSAGSGVNQKALELLLSVLGQPVCQRSTGIMEQTLQVLEIALQGSNKQLQQTRDTLEVATKAAEAEKEKEKAQQAAAEAEREKAQKAAADSAEKPESAPDAATATEATTTPADNTTTTATTPAPAAPPSAAPATTTETEPWFGGPLRAAAGGSTGVAAGEAGASAPAPAISKPADSISSKAAEIVASTSATLAKTLEELHAVLGNIPEPLLRQLPVLLGREGLSELAYTRLGNVVKLLVDLDPSHTSLILDQVTNELCRVGESITQSLKKLQAQPGLDADGALVSSIAVQGGMLLRMLHSVDNLSKQKIAQNKATTSSGVPTPAAPSSSVASVFATPAPGGPSAAAAGSSQPAGSSSVAPAGSVQIPKVIPVIAQKLEPLWKALSSAISVVEETLKSSQPDRVETSAASRILPQGAAQVMPLVEAFFVLCTLQGAVPPAPANNPRDGSQTFRTAPSSTLRQQLSDHPPTPALFVPPTPAAAPQPSGALSPRTPAAPAALSVPVATPAVDLTPSPQPHTAFTRFAERHKRMLNAYLRRTPQLLEGSFAPLLHVPKLIDFDNKRAYFRTKVRSEERTHHHHFSLRLSVRRDHVFEDSFHALRDKSAEQLKGKLTVAFRGEEGIDAGGVSREWYQIMAREIFNPNTALFVQVPEGGTTFQPNPNSVVQTERHYDHLDFFRFVGKLVGKALYDGQLMDAYFTRSFYKHMLGLAITYEDIEAVDPAYYKNLKWMLENDITDVLDLTFTAETDFFGKKEIVELCAGGKDVKVTEDNKREYVNLIARHHMTTAIREQIEAFLQGFWELIPPKLISIFNDHELELLISGLPDIDVDDLRAHTEYTGFTAASPVIQWFWQVVREMDKQDLALLLQFVTGTSKVPLDGFRALQGISGPQRFQIHKAYVPTNRLPSAHTCFNQLDLPEYETKEQLIERLMVAIHEGSEGFGFG